MRIHSHEPEEVKKILAQLNLSFTIMDKKASNNDSFKWFNLPSFVWDDKLLETTYFDVKVSDRTAFFKAFNVKETKRQFIHYKKKEQPYKKYQYRITHEINPKYPIFIISKGRSEKRLTVDTLEAMNCPYTIVVEPQEVEAYMKHIKSSNILVLPYEYCGKNQGSIPARNFIWEYATKRGFEKHWILDDNIRGFFRWNYNVKLPVNSGVVFKCLEDYLEHFTNVGMAAMNYNMDLAAIHIEKAMITHNTKCYSCILINNKLMDDKKIGRWEGKFNEDVDLTIRTLKGGLCSMAFNNFLSGKCSTGMKGGNNEIYKQCSEEGFMEKYKALEDKHPECVKMQRKHKDKRPHHKVNYNKVAKAKPIMKDIEPQPINELNMVFEIKN